MTELISLLYIIAFALFIYGLMGLTGPRTAVRGNIIAGVGMAIAIVATLLTPGTSNWLLIALGLILGTVVGVPSAKRVKMTAMPQLVALFNGVGGGAVALVAWVEFRDSHGYSTVAGYVTVTSLFAAIVGSVSFWGSLIAFGKLQEVLPEKADQPRPPHSNRLNAALSARLRRMRRRDRARPTGSELMIIGVLLSAAVLGVMVVLPIGGADMPVVISLLNALTGLSAAATGLALDNTAMIVAGMIVGASGTILTNLMAKAMNRSIPAIVAGGFGGTSSTAGTAAVLRTRDRTADQCRRRSAADGIRQPGGHRPRLRHGRVAGPACRREMAGLLEGRGVEVRHAIHPVAGRMPGHMNVLLAEADVPYEHLKEMDEINGEFSRADVALVIGANDVTNPAARSNPASPIYGMPILNVDHAKSVIVLKRSMGAGFAGIDNELYFDPKTAMLFGDAKSSVAEITQELKVL